MSACLTMRSGLCAGLVTAVLATGAAADDGGQVVVTIRPIHSLVAGVMAGVGEPTLLLPGGASPHAYALKPSQARALAGARVVVRVSPYLETFLERPITNLAEKAVVLTLDKTPGVTLHKVREGGLWEAHDHGEHEHAAKKHDHDHDKHGHDKHAHDKHDHDKHDHDKHAHDKHDHDKHAHDKHDHDKHAHDKHDHDKHAQDKHDHDKHAHDRDEDHKHDGHAHGEHDPHVWLDPANAQKLTTHIAETLSKAWPAQAATFRANAERQQARLEKLDAELRTATRGLGGKPYIVFHDAYRYFEERYGLQPAGAITFSPDRPPGARRLLDIRNRIRDAKAICVFAEPQFQPKLVDTLVEGTKARRGTLDPLGAAVASGPDQYFALMRNLAAALAGCLTPKT